MTSRLGAFASALCLVGLPVFVLATYVDRPLWMWLALAAFGTVALFRVMSYMQDVIAYDREVNPQPEPEPTTLRQDYDKAMLGFLEATGLIRPMERFVAWLARKLPPK